MEAGPVDTSVVSFKHILHHSITAAEKIRVHGALQKTKILRARHVLHRDVEQVKELSLSAVDAVAAL